MKKALFSKILILVLAMLTSLFIFTACGKTENASGDALSGMTEENTLVVSYPEDTGNMNPHTYDSAMFAQGLVYEGLTRYDKGEVVPAIAESWKVSPDGKEYTFYLRQGALFSDGTPITAAIVKKNFDAVLKHKADHNWMETINQMKEVVAVDDNTLKITFNKPFSAILQELAFVRPLRIGAEAIFPASGDTAEGIVEPVGSGPWKQIEHVVGQYTVFQRNENYAGTKPQFEYLKVMDIPDINTAVSSLKAGEIDLIYDLDGQMSGDVFNALKAEGYATLISDPMTTYNVLVSTKEGYTKDLNVRLALEYAVDKQSIVDNVFYGLQAVADTIMPTSTPYCDIGLKGYEYNQQKAVELLEKSGWVLKNGETYRSKNGEVLDIGFYYDANNSLAKTVGQILQNQYQQVGIKITLVGQDSETLIKTEQNGLCELSLCESWGAPYDPHSYLSSFRDVCHGDYMAQLGLSMKDEIDDAISAALNSTNEEEIQAKYAYVLTTLHEQAVYIPLTYTTKFAVYDPALTGIRFNTSCDMPAEEFGRK